MEGNLPFRLRGSRELAELQPTAESRLRSLRISNSFPGNLIELSKFEPGPFLFQNWKRVDSGVLGVT